MLLDIVAILGGLVLLTVGAEALVRGASTLAARFGVSQFVIGLTIVGFGTSAPELFASSIAAWKGISEIAVGNVVGSNIFNIAIILGLTVIVRPMTIDLLGIRRELGWMIAAAFVPLIAIVTGGEIGRLIGAIGVAMLITYTVRSYYIGKKDPDSITAGLPGEHDTSGPALHWSETPLVATVMVIAGLGMLVLGSALLVEGAVGIAKALNISELVIGLTIVAAGTSMPELATSIVAARRSKPELALGNILGSNVFNIFGILGVACILTPQTITRQTLVLDTPVMILVSVALAIMCATGRVLSRKEGVALVVVYLAYLGSLLFWAPGYFAAA